MPDSLPSGAFRACSSRWLRSGRTLFPAILRGVAVAALASAGGIWADEAAAQGAISAGDAVTTQFSGLDRAPDGTPRPQPDGAVFRALGLGAPGFSGDGSLWENPQLLFSLTARDIGQVFGIALDDAEPANIYLAATSAFGLYRGSGAGGWAEGMWGPGGGPGTIWKLDADRGYRPEIFARLGYLDAPNGGAGLGQLAFDPWHDQLFVSDLESGLIHRLDMEGGEILESFDHGVDGRATFQDAASGEGISLDVVQHVPGSTPNFDDCAVAEDAEQLALPFDSAPECWNYADFRRRVWGLGLFQDPDDGPVRLYYAVWGGAGLGNPDWEAAGEDARTSIWSIALSEDGWFDPSQVRREIILPGLVADDADAQSETSPVTDIAFTADGVMILAERGRPAPYFEEAEYTQLAEQQMARVLRLVRSGDGTWQMEGRYEVGFLERDEARPPRIRANAAGGVALGFGYAADGIVDFNESDGTVWMSVTALCTEDAPCAGGEAVSGTAAGIQGTRVDVAVDPDEASVDEARGPGSSYLLPLRGAAEIPGDVGDVEIYRTDPLPQRIAEAPRRVDRPRVVETPPRQAEPSEPQAPDAPDEVAETEPERDVEAETEAEAQVEAEVAEPVEVMEPARLASDLAVTMEGVDGCEPGSDCVFEVTVTNAGDVVFDGPLLVTTAIQASGVAFRSASPENWTCTASAGSVFCRQESFRLEPQATAHLSLSLRPGEGHRQPRLESCAAVTWPGLSGRERIRAVQAELGNQGFDAGAADGVLGPRTSDAIAEAEASFGLPRTGEIGGRLVERLFGEGAYVFGDGNPENDRDCATVPVDIPPPPAVASPSPRQEAPAARAPEARHDAAISQFHARRSSQQHNPATSAPTPMHRQDLSAFHMRGRSSAHDGVRTGIVPGHDSIMSQFHRRFDSGAHDIETSSVVQRHDFRMSRFHEMMRSQYHDGITSGAPPRHNPYTSGWR